MLNEPASSLDDGNIRRKRFDPTAIEPDANGDDPAGIADTVLSELRALVRTVFAIERETYHTDTPQVTHREDLMLFNPSKNRIMVTFHGRLTLPSEAAYDKLDGLLKQRDLLPVFRQDGDGHLIHVVQGRIVPPRGGNRTSLFLFLLTVMSVLFVGANMAINEIGATNPGRARMLQDQFWQELWRGWPYAVSILAILGAHEMGHYLMARRHKVAVSLPYFLPFPLGLFGTLGAAIRLREPMRNRKVLMDIGAAGPLAGLVVAIPVLLIGLATSRVETLSPGSMLVEGNSIAYALAKIVTFGRFLPDGTSDVIVNQLAWAGWTGLFVTGLNLIPIGQLDGGHVLYSLLGRYARYAFYPAIATMAVLVVLSNGALLLLLVLLFFVGRFYAVPLDDITPLNPERRWLAGLTLVIFVLVFVPIPLEQVVIEGGRRGPDFSVGLLILGMWLAHSRLRWLRR